MFLLEHDYSTYDGAVRLARLIEQYWQAHGGYVVRCEVIPVAFRTSINGPLISGGGYGLRSDLINGLPPRPPGQKPDYTEPLPNNTPLLPAAKIKAATKVKRTTVIGEIETEPPEIAS
jgi:hypothetical protein